MHEKSIPNGASMNIKDSINSGKPELDANLKRRILLRIGTLMTAISGAAAISTMGSGIGNAAPGDKTQPMNYVPIAEKGAAMGVATLDIASKLPISQIPDLSSAYSEKPDNGAKPVGKGELLINVKDYGAKGDGISDDTTAIQGAINDAHTMAGGGIVFLPRGTYAVSSLTARPYVSVRGAGRYRTTVVAQVSGAPALVLFPVGMVQSFYLEDLALSPGIKPNPDQHAVYAKAVGDGGTPDQGGWWYGGLRRVRIDRFDGHGIWLRGGGPDFLKPHQFLVFEGVEVFAGPGAASRCLYLTGQVGQVVFTACQFDGNGQGIVGGGTSIEARREVNDAGLFSSDVAPYSIEFFNCTVQANALGARIERAAGLKFNNCWFEDLRCGVVFETSVEMGIVEGCNFSDTGSDRGNGYAIKVGAASCVTAIGNRFAGTYDKALVADSSSGSFFLKGNRSNQSPMSTTGLTKQPPSIAGTIDIQGSNTAIISGGPAISNITSRHAPGEPVYLRAWLTDFSIVSGGNISLGNKASPLVVPTGAIITLVRMDLGATNWSIVSIT
ncbi:glycosyl hydrolase family 28-related protein [Pseudarthrobacter oxydans]|uniref:glycosyl hydrolase family 28-related protein n=1 Tax=Pseudarthrobacter oxydans TaxID=1671 RepID=UPI002AA7FC8F|nr:glycosyl hydrolase family 28-related protein [Pseudarthrobacter oxydans]WPU08580.1 glycosyl hydrolase family 28-related protein [Pseudarthrobacter oxydans]